MSIVDEKRARESTESRRNRNVASPRYSRTPEVVVTDGFGTPTSLPHTIDPELGAEEEVPPAYSEHHDQLSLHHNGFDAGAVVTEDGRVNINLNQTSRLLAHSLRDQLKADARVTAESPLPPAYIPPSLGGQPGQTPPPKLNVVIQIVGSRGDVQPFIALGKVLKNTYGHRVRLATHPVFQKFVEENDLEFFSIGGDPAELMAFMVKNPGLMPGFEAVKSGEVTKRRKGIEQIILGCWRSCIETGKGLGPAPSFSRMERDYAGLMPDSYDPLNKPFVADAIIANPPSFAHIHVAEKLGVPLHLMFTSPALIPKPIDWGQNIDVAGFYFLNLASSFTPEPELAAFLAAGPPPIYIGFGSIVVDDPNGLTRMIFDAVAETGVRALVSKGWGGLGADDVGIPEGVFMLGNVPHDWLFKHVSAVCHHGGAGTTAAGINSGKPTIVVPFFGDQPFWGAMVARAGAGPDPIPYKKLTSEGLAEAIRIVMKPETQERAQELGAKIREEKGTDIGAQSFHRHLDTDNMRCSIVPSRTAVWRVRRTQTLLSALAAATLVQLGYLQYSDLKLFRVKEYNTEDHPTDPISAVTSAFVGDLASIGLSVADFPRDIFKAARGKPKPHEVTEDVPDNATVATNGETSSTVALTEVASGATVIAAAEDLPMAELDAGTERRAEAEAESNRQPRKLRLKPGNDAMGGLTLSFSSDTLPNPDDVVPAQRHRAASSPETPHRAGSPHHNGPTSPPQEHDKLERVMGAGKSVNNIVATGMRTPMNFCMGLAKGFRNLPRLYNDDTVRPPEKVTGIGSGLKIAGKEFGFGMYDGISGLVTQPYRGAQKQGALGLVKGFGKGIGGLAFKPWAAMWSLPAYAMAGVDAEIRSFFANNAHNYIVASRISQGNEDYKQASDGERSDIEVRWLARKSDLKGFYAMKQRQKGKSRDQSPESQSQSPPQTQQRRGVQDSEEEPRRSVWKHAKRVSTDEPPRNRLEEWRARRRRQTESATISSSSYLNDSASVLTMPTSPPPSSAGPAHERDDEFEQAIQAAVHETSTGDPREDARIERAIRASVTALRKRSDTVGSGMTGSSNVSGGYSGGPHTSRTLIDSKQALPPDLPPRPSSQDLQDIQDLENITDEEYQALIEQAVQLSVLEQERHRHRDSSDEDDVDFRRVLQRSQTELTISSNEQDDEEYRMVLEASHAEYANNPNHNEDEDEALRKAIEASQAEQERQKQHGGGDGGNDDALDEELRKAIEASEREHREKLALKTEEDIVMEYVKRQSLAEQQFGRSRGKQKVGSGSGSGAGGIDEEMDEDLRAALERSRQLSGRGSGGDGAADNGGGSGS